MITSKQIFAAAMEYFDGEDVIKLLLSGATCVQVVSTVYKNGLTQIRNIIKELEKWMDSKNYNSIDEFRGKLSKNKLTNNPFVYKRAQYVDLLMNSEEIILGGKFTYHTYFCSEFHAYQVWNFKFNLENQFITASPREKLILTVASSSVLRSPPAGGSG